MQVSVWGKYLFGQSDAILKTAGSRAALWTGISLVLLTAFARSCDQTYFFENPFLWLFGPLLFSLVSGSWLYAVVYAGFARREMSAPGDAKPPVDGGWISFMALFWMTAPIAWLYAIPVERFMDSLSAARANVALLSLVSVWRVLLMVRVLQVTTKAPFMHALVWVLFAASIEVLVVFFFGGAFARAIMAGMGGMRNSPEENVMIGAMNTAFVGALWIASASFVLSLAWRPKQLLVPLPQAAKGRVCWPPLVIAACFWAAIAIVPQRELANTVKVERLLANGQPREALDILAGLQPRDFAPARTLPPKPFERSLFKELPDCLAAIRSSDPEWVRSLMLSRLDTMISHGGPGYRRGIDTTQPKPQQVQAVLSGLSWHGPDAEGLAKIFEGLKRLPEGQEWIRTNSVFVAAAWRLATEEGVRRHRSSDSANPQSWLNLSNQLRANFDSDALPIPGGAFPP